GDPIARRRPRDPRHRIAAETAGRGDVLETEAGVEAAREIADDLAVFRGQQNDVELLILPVSGSDRHQLTRGRRLDGDYGNVRRLAALRLHVPAVILRPLLLEARLQPILHLLLLLLDQLC